MIIGYLVFADDSEYAKYKQLAQEECIPPRAASDDRLEQSTEDLKPPVIDGIPSLKLSMLKSEALFIIRFCHQNIISKFESNKFFKTF